MGAPVGMERNTPLRGFDYWDSHPQHSLKNWQHLVSNGDTRQGYWQWVRAEIYAENPSEVRSARRGARKAWGAGFSFKKFTK